MVNQHKKNKNNITSSLRKEVLNVFVAKHFKVPKHHLLSSDFTAEDFCARFQNKTLPRPTIVAFLRTSDCAVISARH